MGEWVHVCINFSHEAECEETCNPPKTSAESQTWLSQFTDMNRSQIDVEKCLWSYMKCVCI